MAGILPALPYTAPASLSTAFAEGREIRSVQTQRDQQEALRNAELIGRAAVDADTPEKWAANMATLGQLGVPDTAKWANRFDARDQIIRATQSVADQLNSKTAQQFVGSLGGAGALSTIGMPQSAPRASSAPALDPGYLANLPPIGAAPPVGGIPSRPNTDAPQAAAQAAPTPNPRPAAGGQPMGYAPTNSRMPNMPGRFPSAQPMGYDSLDSRLPGFRPGQNGIGQEYVGSAGADGLAGGAGMDVLGDAKLPPSLIMAESGGRQFGRNGQPLTSSAGAIGVAQVMPDTAREMAAELGIPFDEERYRNDPAYNEMLGARYYDKALQTFGGDTALAAAAYNAGIGAVQGYLAGRRGLPDETVAYVQRVTGRNLGGGGSVRPATRDIQAPIPNGVPLDSLQILARNPTYAGTAISTAINQYARPKDTTEWARSGDGWIFNQRTGEFQSAPGIGEIKPTDDIREYEFAKGQGFPGSFQDWQLANRRAGATTINTGDMSNPEALGDKKFAESMGTKQAESFNSIIDGGRMALQSVGDLNTLEAALDQLPQGGFEPLKAQFANYAASLGIDVQDALQLGSAQAVQSIVARIAPRLRVPGSGTTSDRDLALFLQSLPSLANSPEGNRLIISTLRAFAQRGIQEAQIVNDGIGQGKPRSQIQRDLQALGPVITTEQARALFAAPRGGQQDLPQFQPGGAQPLASQPSGPQPGDVEMGYRFKGGNPADPNSWERVQ